MGNLAAALTLQSEEAALVEELRAGSEEAFAWLIAHYHQPIYSLARAHRAQPRRRCRSHAGSLRQGLPRHQRFSRRVVVAHMDLPHCAARGVEPAALVDAAQQQEIPIEQEIARSRNGGRRCAEGHAGRSVASRPTKWPCTRRTGRAWSRRCARCRSRFAPR